MPDLSLTFMRFTPKGYKIEHSCFFYSTVDVVLLEKKYLRLWSCIKNTRKNTGFATKTGTETGPLCLT